MSRRLFIIIAGSLPLIALANNFSFVLEIARRLMGRYIIKAKKLPPASQRIKAQLNPEGVTVSVELALNSRCTSDYNGHQDIFHWGLFDPKKRLAPDDIQRLVNHVQIPRFSDGFLKMKYDGNMLYFLMTDESDELKRSWMMIESGMQQQVVCLLCSAFGIGMQFRGLSDDGTKVSDSLHANMRMKLDAMQPSYNGSYWCDSTPEGWRPWLKGNLPSPNRNGKMSLTDLVASLNQDKPPINKSANITAISQLLWAARGRTPHYYKSKPWGMTIPVSRGHQNITSVFLVHSGRLYRYSNWETGRPTHRLDVMNGIENASFFNSLCENRNYNCHIILSSNEKSGKAYWEIGYQLINIILQSKALEIDILPTLLVHNNQEKLQDLGINNACAIASMHFDSVALHL